ncbi:MAG: sulfatase-like hydrolase/transferase, partial [Candidatus Eremiobacterota bacterium]
FYDVLTSPQGEGMKFAGGTAAVAGPVLLTLGTLAAVACPIWWLAGRLRGRLVAPLAVLTSLTLLAPLGMADPAPIAAVFQSLPTRHPGLRRAILSAWAGLHPREVDIVALFPRPLAGPTTVTLTSRRSVELGGWRLTSSRGTVLLNGRLEAGQVRRVELALDQGGDRVVLSGPGSRVEARYSARQVEPGRELQRVDPARRPGYLDQLDRRLQPDFERLGRALGEPPPGPSPAIPPDGPHVVVILLESWRADSLEATPRLAGWFRRGLQLERHYSGSNTSHLGLYSLLYARNPIFYKRDLSARAHPVMSQAFRESGYRCSFRSSSAFRGWKWLDRILSEDCFDSVEVDWEGPGDWTAWIERDQRILRELPERLRAAREPQFAVVFLQSTHFPYAYPPEFEVFRPCLSGRTSLAAFAACQPSEIRNRYANSARFMEDELDRLLCDLDLNRTVVLITGDHGESFREDGALSHGTRASEVQFRVPCAILGAGVSPGRIPTATVHADLLPTLVHVLSGREARLPESPGRDLLAAALEDRVLLCPLRSCPPYELVLVQGSDRLLVHVLQPLPRVRPDLGPDPGARLEAAGLVDARGTLRWDLGSRDWTHALREELSRLR